MRSKKTNETEQLSAGTMSKTSISLERRVALTDRKTDNLEKRMGAGFAEMRTGFVEMHANFAEMRTGLIEMRTGFIEMDAGFAEMRTGFVEMHANFAEMRAGFSAVGEAITEINDRYDREIRHVDVRLKRLEKPRKLRAAGH